SKLTGENLTLYGTGEDQRAFTYVNDLNDFIPKFFAKREIKSCIFSSSEVFSVREIVEKVSQVIDFKGRVPTNGERTDISFVFIIAVLKLCCSIFYVI
ncbi:MAG: hypothetical protein EBY22_16970, partial [Gammaproteobacteria bacterium]|nr:hypothetical protein [Gammaproteobacteria bacterium]